MVGVAQGRRHAALYVSACKSGMLLFSHVSIKIKTQHVFISLWADCCSFRWPSLFHKEWTLHKRINCRAWSLARLGLISVYSGAACGASSVGLLYCHFRARPWSVMPQASPLAVSKVDSAHFTDFRLNHKHAQHLTLKHSWHRERCESVTLSSIHSQHTWWRNEYYYFISKTHTCKTE